MFEGPLATFLLTLTVGVVLATFSWLVARRSGLLPLQSSLVDTLQDTVEALERQVAMTKEERDKAVVLAETHRSQIERLNAVIIDLVSENADFRKRLHEPPRHRTAAERELDQ